MVAALAAAATALSPFLGDSGIRFVDPTTGAQIAAATTSEAALPVSDDGATVTGARPEGDAAPEGDATPGDTWPSADYGTVVDRPEPAPDPSAAPGELPHRPQTLSIHVEGGRYHLPAPGRSDGSRILSRAGDGVELYGRGYFRIRWDVTGSGPDGVLIPPTWTTLRGRLFHVASGGGHRLDDPLPGASGGDGSATRKVPGPTGAPQPWQVEYYYLDGSVTLNRVQGRAGYDLAVAAVSRDRIEADLSTAPDLAGGAVRYGVVRDPGDDTAPVPQYCTRSSPRDPARVPQWSRVGVGGSG